MAETVAVPGIGPVSKNAALVGGAVGAGIIGYAWWQRRKNNQTLIPTMDVNDAVGATQYTGSANVAGATGDATVTTTPDKNAILTNSDWTQAATNYLSATAGMDSSAVAVALGKYIAQDSGGLTDNQVEMVQAARAAFGDPPTGGPYKIIHASPTTPTGGGAGTEYPVPPGGPSSLPPIAGANPYSYLIQAGDTLRNLVPRLYPWDPTVDASNPNNAGHISDVAWAIYRTNENRIPYGIDVPLPAGVIITYY